MGGGGGGLEINREYAFKKLMIEFHSMFYPMPFQPVASHSLIGDFVVRSKHGISSFTVLVSIGIRHSLTFNIRKVPRIG